MFENVLSNWILFQPCSSAMDRTFWRKCGLSFNDGTWHAGNVWLFSRHKICIYVITEESIVADWNLNQSNSKVNNLGNVFQVFILLYLPSDLQLKDTNYSDGTEKKYGRGFVTMFSFCNVSLCRNEVKNLISRPPCWNTVVEILILVYKEVINFWKPNSGYIFCNASKVVNQLYICSHFPVLLLVLRVSLGRNKPLHRVEWERQK